MTAIVDFITARLDEDEQAALAAQKFTNATPWRFVLDSYGGHHWAGSIEDEPLPGVSENEIAQEVGEVAWGQHITLHDPVRVVRQTAALRAIVRDHTPRYDNCERCNDGFGDYDGADQWHARSEPFPCPTVKNLAAIWSDHPRYQEAWKP